MKRLTGLLWAAFALLVAISVVVPVLLKSVGTIVLVVGVIGVFYLAGGFLSRR